MVEYSQAMETKGGSLIMLAAKIPKASFLALIFISFSIGLLLSPMEDWNVEAAMNADEILTAGDQVPEDNTTIKRSNDFRKQQGWEKRLLGENYSQYNFKKSRFQSQNRHSLHLKSPGKLPGIELGVEMHSLQALQSVVPSENLPKGMNLKQEQPLLLPPSINAPDYNGGFLRFTW